MDSFANYFEAFKHPAEVEGDKRISYYELIGISWSFHLIKAIYTIFAMYMGMKSYEYLSGSENFTHLIFNSVNYKMQKWSLLSTLFSVIFYPFVFQFAHKFWKGCFKFYLQIYETEVENFEEKSDEILASAFTSNLFLLIPIVGNVLSYLAFFFFLFKGLGKKFDFTPLQSLLVLITPLFMLFLFAIFSASYFVFLFTLI